MNEVIKPVGIFAMNNMLVLLNGAYRELIGKRDAELEEMKSMMRHAKHFGLIVENDRFDGPSEKNSSIP